MGESKSREVETESLKKWDQLWVGRGPKINPSKGREGGGRLH